MSSGAFGRKLLILFAMVAPLALSGCLANDKERALAGAATGAVVADTLGGDAIKGALAGAAAGALCDDVNLCN